jgi:hypothetical protein
MSGEHDLFHAGQFLPVILGNKLLLASNLRVSSTLRPTGRSFTDICLSTPEGSMMNKPLKILLNKKIFMNYCQQIVQSVPFHFDAYPEPDLPQISHMLENPNLFYF